MMALKKLWKIVLILLKSFFCSEDIQIFVSCLFEKKYFFEYLKNKNNFLDEIQNIFHNFWNSLFW